MRTHKRSVIFMAMAAASCMASAAFAGPLASPPQVGSASRVLVIPFSTINVPESDQWISRGVQETIVADLGHAGGFSPISFQGQVIVEDNATAARLARSASAPLAVRGAAQMVGGNVRLTAQVIDAKSGDTLSTASVTGPVNDLLKLEDNLSAQLRGVPESPAAATATAPAVAATTTPASVPIVVQQPAPPQIIVISQPSQPAYPDYSAYDGYPYGSPYGYGYGGYGLGLYGGFYPGVIFINSGNHHDHHHDHGHGPGPAGGTMPTPHIPGGPGPNALPIPHGVSLPIQRAVSGPVGGSSMRMAPMPVSRAGGGITHFAMARSAR